MLDPLIAPLRAQLQSLLDAPRLRIQQVLASRPAAAVVSGVYAISVPDRPEQVVYIGRTKTKTMLGRLQDHCRLATPSDLRGMLSRHAAYPQDPQCYDVRWTRVDEDVSRAQLELFAIAVVKPPFNRYI